MPKCLYCQKEVEIKRNCLGKYCNNKCQGAHTHQKLIDRIEQGVSSARNVRAYLIEKYGNCCMNPNCAWNQEKQPVNCELEHIDGNFENNRLENCILLCPNCHSLTPTYKNKNKGNGRHSRRKRYAEGKSY